MIGRRGSPSTEVADKPRGFDDYDLRLGDILRGERATMSKSLLDVQRELKIKASYIAAIENADASAFETPGFVAGYVRSYARYLGLDPEWAFGRFCDEAGFAVSHGMSSAASGPRTGTARRKPDHAEPLANPNASFVPRGEAFLTRVEPGAIGSVLVLMALIAGVGFGGWTVLREVQKVQLSPVDQAPGVIAELDPLAAGIASQSLAPAAALAALPAPDRAPRAPDAIERLYRPQTLDVPVLVPRDGPIAAIDPQSVGALAVAAADAARPLPEPVPALGDTPVQVAAAEPPVLELLAVRPSWVRVQSADGTVLFEKILDAGERYAVPAMEEPPLLRAGNSGSLYFAVNGQTYGPAAPGAQVVKNVALSAESLAAGYSLADLGQDEDLARLVTVAEAAAAGTEPSGE